MSVLAIVPARGGSKSLPRKNVRPLGGHPLLAYSIAAGLQARQVDRVIVSTDDEEIAGIGRQYGAEVPFLRPAELAEDDTPDLPVFQHALEWLAENEGFRAEIVVQLRPTSPLRPHECVDRGIDILNAHAEADSVRAVVPTSQNPYKMWRISPEGRLVPLLKDEGDEAYNTPRQLLPPTFWQTGHLDVIRAATIWEKKSMTGDVVLPLLMEPAYAVDIDRPADHDRAEELLRRGGLTVVRPARPSHGSAPGRGTEP